jgi:TolB protein
MKIRVSGAFLVLAFVAGWLLARPVAGGEEKTASLLVPGEERHLRNVRQLTFGGQNAEAYFSADDNWLIFQHAGGNVACDQMYIIPVETPDGNAPTPRLVSTGKGRTTCGYFFPAGDRILFIDAPCIFRVSS